MFLIVAGVNYSAVELGGLDKERKKVQNMTRPPTTQIRLLDVELKTGSRRTSFSRGRQRRR